MVKPNKNQIYCKISKKKTHDLKVGLLLKRKYTFNMMFNTIYNYLKMKPLLLTIYNEEIYLYSEYSFLIELLFK